LALITGKSYDVFEELKLFETCFSKRYKQLKTQKQNIFEGYHDALYLKNVKTLFSFAEQTKYGKILGVTHQGQLEVAFEDGSIQQFSNKEISLA
jgi:biotin-(acetyl-CoA carboxylase) ligase